MEKRSRGVMVIEISVIAIGIIMLAFGIAAVLKRDLTGGATIGWVAMVLGCTVGATFLAVGRGILRMDKHLLIRELAILVGVSLGTIINWEIRNVRPAGKKLERLRMSCGFDLYSAFPRGT